MSQVPFLKWGDASATPRDVDPNAFGERVRARVLYDAIIMYEANRRVGTQSTKGRTEVAGTSRKPWKQKHTGRARVGQIQSPLWKGGGVAHGPKPRDYSYAMPKQARSVALRSAIRSKFDDGELFLVERFGFDAPSTKSVVKLLQSVGAKGKSLIVSESRDENLWKSARNIHGVEVRTASDVNAYDVLRFRNLVLSEGALSRLQERAGNATD
ncbi:MAG: 50S ribosomal protein L4 [Planctomycetes bacterium]|nr:50S ribosomal protein L4 [Planctomycetota bacterium]